MIATRSTRWSRTPTWWSISRSSSWDRERRALGSTCPEPATSSRRRWRPRAPEGSCTPRRSPPTATTPITRSHHRRGAAPRLTRALPLRTEGGVRSGPDRDHHRYDAGGIRPAAVHRGGAEGAGPRGGHAVESTSRCGTEGFQVAAVAQAAVPRSWHASATRTPRRRRRRDRLGRNNFRSAGCLQHRG